MQSERMACVEYAVGYGAVGNDNSSMASFTVLNESSELLLVGRRVNGRLDWGCVGCTS
jgi:hypothetical protein